MDVVPQVLPQTPLDDNVKVPEAIKRRSAAVDAYYADQAKQAQQVPQPTSTPQPEPPATTPSAPAPQAAIVSAPQTLSSPPAVASALTPPTNGQAPPGPPETLEEMRAKFERANSRYAAEAARNREMQATMEQMGNELMRTHEAMQRRPEPPPPPQYYLTQDDEANFGPQMLDLSMRAAKHALMPELEQIRAENQAAQRKSAMVAKATMDQQVQAAVPNYLEIDRNPRWLNWLSLPEPYSGRIRQHLLDEAIAAFNAPRVIHFFRGFLAEEAATGHIAPAGAAPVPANVPPREPVIPLASLAAPGRVQPATGGEPGPGEKPYYHRADITRAHRAYMQGHYRGREAEYEALQAEFIRAQNEGRLLG